jgi:uncharacterized protein involved in cysteine biosynthesis
MMIGRFALGFGAAIRGLFRTAGNATVRATYRHLVLAIFVLALMLDAAGIYGIWLLLGSGTAESWYTGAALTILLIVGVATVLIAAPVIAIFVVNAIFPVLAEKVFVAALRVIDEARAQELSEAAGLPITRAVMGSLRRLTFYLAVMVVILLFYLVPVVGPVAAGLAQLLFTARMLGWELLDPYLDRCGLEHKAQRAFVKEHGAAIAGFALPWTLILSIPIVGPLLLGLAQGATASLVHDVIEKDRVREQVKETGQEREREQELEQESSEA